MADPPRDRLLDFPARHNGLNLIRLILAIVSHSFGLSDFSEPPRLGDRHLGDYAVRGFFVVSVRLIMQSRLISTLAAFSWRRALRIVPGYLAGVAVVAGCVERLHCGRSTTRSRARPCSESSAR